MGPDMGTPLFFLLKYPIQPMLRSPLMKVRGQIIRDHVTRLRSFLYLGPRENLETMVLWVPEIGVG